MEWLPSGWGLQIILIWEHFLGALFPYLAVLILLSGFDDLIVDAVWIWSRLKASRLRQKIHPVPHSFPPGPKQLASAPQRPIAIIVPLWHEHEVIGHMLEHNLAAIRYSNYHFFCGCYPNDSATQMAIQDVANRFPNVHMCVCPHDGPTSKADCLNWSYQHIGLFEEQSYQRFEIIVTHDAEDLIHPEELSWINYYSSRYDFIQTPVLALKTPLWDLTHGVYCDEFAEYHTKDMTVRATLGGFVPGSGVGTGYKRDALERLARVSANQLFEPAALTEDYESGIRLFRLGAKQTFLPIAQPQGDFVATREYFPQTWKTAVRQRTRWVTGISLQGWERFGWKGTPGEVYWLWRDRKGLIANPVSLASNMLFVYAVTTGMWTRMPHSSRQLALGALALQAIRTLIRMHCTSRIYGWIFALGVPFRTVWGNSINSAATCGAVYRYVRSKIRREPLKWLKTTHAYPTRATLLASRRRLGEILVGSGYLTPSQMETALSSIPPGRRLGEHLIALRMLNEESLYEALSLQQALPCVHLEPHDIARDVARSLPEPVVREWRVLPFRVVGGSLHLAAPEPPSAKMTAALRGFTTLELKFHLLTPSSFQRLSAALL